VHEKRVEWLSVDSDTPRVFSGSCNDEAIKALPRPAHVTLVFPTRHVSFARFQLPTKNPQQVAMAARSLIEEKLVDDVDDMHILFEQAAGDGVEVAAVERGFLNNLITQLEGCGLTADFAMPDCFLLPYTPGGWTVYENSEGLLIRSGKFSGFFYDYDWLDQLGHEHIFDITDDKPSMLSIYHYGDKPKYDFQQLIPVENQQLSSLDDEHGLLELVLENGVSSDTSNFLSGEFSPVQSSKRTWMNWQLPIYALAASLFLVSVFLFIQNRVYDSRLNDLQDQADATFKEMFPGVEPIRNLGVDAYRLQFQREVDKRIDQSRQDHPALMSLYRVLSQVKKQSGISLQALSYVDGTYTLDIQTSGESSTTRFVDAVNKTHTFQAKALSSPADAENQQSRIQIIEKGGV
jgi:type II secretion system protein L